jgi:hypothetical protein
MKHWSSISPAPVEDLPNPKMEQFCANLLEANRIA